MQFHCVYKAKHAFIHKLLLGRTQGQLVCYGYFLGILIVYGHFVWVLGLGTQDKTV